MHADSDNLATDGRECTLDLRSCPWFSVQVTDLLRDKVAELDALAKERIDLTREVTELREKCDRLEKTLQLAQTAFDDKGDEADADANNHAGGDSNSEGGAFTPDVNTNKFHRRSASARRNSPRLSSSTSARITALTQKWKELGVDEQTQNKIMGDLRMTVDERADKYLAHLTEEYAEQQQSIAVLEAGVQSQMALLSKTYVASSVYVPVVNVDDGGR